MCAARRVAAHCGAAAPLPAPSHPSRSPSAVYRHHLTPDSTLRARNRATVELNISNFLYESVSFPPLVNFFRAISPLFRLPEMRFFFIKFRRTDRARCAFKSCLIFYSKGERRVRLTDARIPIPGSNSK